MEHRPESYPRSSDEIDLGELLVTIWEGKWLIAVVITACLGLAAAYLYLAPKTYSTELEIRRITSFQAEPYEFLNRLEFFDIDRDDLLNLFGERLATREDILEAVIAHELVDRNRFDSDDEYMESVREFANSITMEGPGIGGNTDRISISIRPKGPSKQRAAAAFRDVFSNVNEFVRESLEKRFNSLVTTESQMRLLKLEDIVRKIEGTRWDYDLEIEQKLALLTEQAQIARELNLSKPAAEWPIVITSGSLSISMLEEQPYYLFGYEAIEKEIALIEERDDKDVFISELANLEKERRELLNDPYLDRAQAAFDATPIGSAEEFKAAHWDISSNDFKPDTRAALVLALALVLGGMLGLFALLIKVAVTSTKRKLASS